MFKSKRSPFRPGPGLAPPLRAGHDEAARELEKRFQRIRDREAGDIVVLYGPRGNGKTVLLKELQRTAKKRKVPERTLNKLTISAGPCRVAQMLMHGREIESSGLKSAGGGALSFTGHVEREDRRAPTIEQAFYSVLKRKPMVLVIDEAHVLPVEFGQGFLQVAQALVAEGLPLLLVIAGTPGLQAHLGKMDASFWERSRTLRIGRLESDEAVRLALSVPARKSGYPIDEEALDLLVRESQRYPFFVQMLGDESWEAAHARKGSARITLEDAMAGVVRANNLKRPFYTLRESEAKKQGVLAAAVAVSREMLALGDEPAISSEKLESILADVARGTGADPESVCEKLSDIGFVWKSPDGGWESGIPSLCSFFVEECG